MIAYEGPAAVRVTNDAAIDALYTNLKNVVSICLTDDAGITGNPFRDTLETDKGHIVDQPHGTLIGYRVNYSKTPRGRNQIKTRGALVARMDETGSDHVGVEDAARVIIDCYIADDIQTTVRAKWWLKRMANQRIILEVRNGA